MPSLFYSQVSDGVKRALDARKGTYSSDNRKTDDHKWLSGKLAYSTVTATNPKTDKSYTIVASTKGGVGRDSQYSGAVHTINGRFNPDPSLVSITITSIGDLGSVLKSDIQFIVHTLEQLNQCQPFFDIGADVTVEYGWSVSSINAGKPGKFTGKIFNFTYSVNSDGSFTCITNCMSPNYGSYSERIMADSGIGISVTTDAAGTERVITNSMVNILDINNLGPEYQSLQSNQVDTENGIAMVRLPSKLTDADPSTSGLGDDQPLYYMTLEKLVSHINSICKQIDPNRLDILCNSEYTTGNTPTKNKSRFVSANPVQVTFPGFGDYGPKFKLFHNSEYSAATYSGDLSKILLNIQWMSEIYKQISNSAPTAYQRTSDLSIARFMNMIFEAIHHHSGERFKLSIVDIRIETDNGEIQFQPAVIELSYADSNVTPYEITAVTDSSICRSLSLQSKVPSDFATAAFISLQSDSNTSMQGRQLNRLNSVDNTTVIDTIDSDLDAAKLLFRQNGPTDAVTEVLYNAIRRAYIVPNEFDRDVTREALPFPIELTFTLDGINGIVFGNVFTCNYLPSIYRQFPGVSFVATTVTHTITINDWETQVTTICKIQPR